MRLGTNVLLRYVRCWMSRRLLVLGSLMMFVLVAGASALGQAPNSDRWNQLSAANNLDNEGNTPFHIKMTFQLFDLLGKLADTGTVEEWWASASTRRIVISSPLLDGNGTSVKNESAASSIRARYLVNELIGVAVHPVPQHKSVPGEALAVRAQQFGKVPLDCASVTTKHDSRAPSNLPTLCIQPKTDEVRLLMRSNGRDVVERNTIGKFHDTYVALDVQTELLGHSAISGKVTLLQSFDPAKLADLLKPETATAASPEAGKSAHMSGGVAAGSRMSFVQPLYPQMAKADHRSGAVFLHAIISKDGSIGSLVPIAVSDGVFTDAAVDAVRQWKYSPYLLNGEPTEVDTTITVNFEINGRLN